MSYNLKYTYSFKDLNNVANTVEIYYSGATSSSTLIGGIDPFLIEYPERKKFDSIIGSGCEINLISESNMFVFNNLFHIDPQTYMVKHTYSGSTNWLGYLNSELFSEPFVELTNYDVKLTGNDGFSLMDRFLFLNTDGSNITGITSFFALFKIIFDKVGLPFDELRIGITTSLSGFTSTTSNSIFQEITINCENFYDEDNKPMSMRVVLEEILKPFSCYIYQNQGHIYINDYNNVATNASIVYNCFALSAGTYAFTKNVTESIVKVLSGTSYFEEGGDISTGAGINRQVVSYSPYSKSMIVEALSDLKEFPYLPGWSTASGTTKNAYFYRNIGLSGNTYLNIFTPNPTGATFEQSYWINVDDPSLYLQCSYMSADTKICDIKVKPILNIGSAVTDGSRATHDIAFYGCSLKITGQILVKTKKNPYDTTSGAGAVVQRFDIRTVVSSTGSAVQHWGSDTRPTWRTSAASYWIKTEALVTADFQNTWVGIGLYNSGAILPITVDLNGEFNVEIYSSWRHIETTPTVLTNSTKIMEFWLKDLKVELVDIDTGDTVKNNDIEYISTLNSKYLNEGEKIVLKAGTDTYFSDKAKLMYSNGSSIRNFSRGNLTNKKIEQLLLNSVVSNYQQSNVLISGLKLKNTFNLGDIITSSYFSGKKFCVTSLKKNYGDASTEISLIEIFSDNLTI